jgi:cytosine/uracil/thiamine/allantoin permease
MLAGLLVTTTSCEAIAGIFKAGMWTGIVVVVLVIGLIIWLVSRAGGNK